MALNGATLQQQLTVLYTILVQQKTTKCQTTRVTNKNDKKKSIWAALTTVTSKLYAVKHIY